MIEIVEQYISQMSDKYHRFYSWDLCYDKFEEFSNKRALSLELAFYLASWGMYRGSSGLLQRNYIVHEGAVEIICKNKYRELRCSFDHDFALNIIPLILELKNDLTTHYSKKEFYHNGECIITPTNTLLSKIMLGTLGCTPAYDRFFISGLKVTKKNHMQFSISSLTELTEFIKDNIDQIITCKQLIKSKIGKDYPVMKIIDMYFWQIGYNEEMNNRNLNLLSL